MESPAPRPPGGVDVVPYPDAAAPLPARTASGPAGTHLSRALARFIALSERFAEPDLALEARAALEPLEENMLRMVALGQFKRGKSTLVNALLGAPLLPTGVTPVTSIATVVRWAAEPSLTVHRDDGSAQEPGLERLADFVVEGRNPGNALGVRLVEVGYPATLLEDGLVLVDTPGIGSTDRGATERAYGFLPSVDAGLVVISPDPPVGQVEAAYVRELAALTPHLLFVLNKIDRASEEEWREALAFNRQVLADVLETTPEEIEIIPVSAREALEQGGGSVARLRDRIEEFIAAKGEGVRSELAERRLRAVVAKLRVRLDLERRALELEGRELDDRIEALRATLDALELRAERTTGAVMTTVEGIVGRSGDALLADARTRADALAGTLRTMVAEASPHEANATLAKRFDGVLRDGMSRALDAWWDERGPTVTAALLDEMTRAADDLAEARRDASEWIHETFGVSLPEEPRVDTLKESRSFYRSVEGVTPRITVDLLRALLPRPVFRAWLTRRAAPLAIQAMEMGSGQARGDLLYRARETARAFTSELRERTLAGMDGLVDALQRASALRVRTGRAAQARREELDEGANELRLLPGGAR